MSALYILLMCVLSVHSQEEWHHEASLDDLNKVHLKWKTDDVDITMELTAEAIGYAAIGLSPNGGMRGSDIVLGGVDPRGQAHVYDMYAVGNKRPLVDGDNSKDYILLSGSQNDTHTVLKFKRKMETCNEYDFNINDDTMRVIWAYSSRKPTSTDTISYHDRRGSKSLILRAVPGYLPKDYNLQEYSSFDLRFNNVELPKQRTLYKCGIMKAPVFQTKQHIVGFSPVLTPGNEGVVHHIVVYECHHPNGTNQLFERHLNQEGSPCQTGDMPPEFNFCMKIIIAWAIGSEGEMFNENAGLPLQGEIYYLFEVHYDNPNLLENVVDSSGIRLYYTDELRQYDAFSGAVGATSLPSQLIPPGAQDFVSVGVCPGECTSANFPPEGIFIYQILLHAHLVGRAVRLRHFRNGEELRSVGIDNHYDFNYQQTRSLYPPVNVLPGDSLVTECEYNTQQKAEMTYGGVGSDEEMCITFFMYYSPGRVGTAFCMSTVTLASIERPLNIKFQDYRDMRKAHAAHRQAKTYYEKNKAFLSALPLSSPPNTTLWTHINKVTWSERLVNTLETSLLRGAYQATCGRKPLEKIVFNPATSPLTSKSTACSSKLNQEKENSKENTKPTKKESKWTTGENSKIIQKIVNYLRRVSG